MLVYGPGTPFTFRLGQRPDRDIRVNVPEFLWLDPIRTTTQRQAAADAVPPSMINEPAPLKDLAERLDDLVEAASKAKTPEDSVFEDLRVTLGRPPPALRGDPRGDVDARPAQARRLAAAFEPIVRDGILGPGSLPRQEESSRAFLVRMVGQVPDQARNVSLDRVLRERMVRPDGPVFADFVAAFDNPRLGQGLFALAAEKLAGTPTLAFDEGLTAAQRDAARRLVGEVLVSYRKGEVLVEQDKEIGPEHLMLLRKEHQTAVAAQTYDATLHARARSW